MGALVAVIAAAAIVAWLLVRRDSSDQTSAPPTSGAASSAVLISASGLRTISQAANEPIYWLGPRADRRYELTRTANGRTFIRYLPPSAAAGSKVAYLTVGTYRLPNAFTATQAAARKSGSTRVPVAAGAVAFFSKARPSSVYVSFPGSDYQIEVYDPHPAAARSLVHSGAVKPVGTIRQPLPSGAARIVAASGMAAFARSVGHRIYWAGTIPGQKYETTSLSDGRVYVRYLPPGAAAGTKKPHLTVGTYPLKNAYSVTRALLKDRSSRTVSVNGGVALYSGTRPTNVYVAYKGVPYQIEVYSPSAAQARRTAARLAPLG